MAVFHTSEETIQIVEIGYIALNRLHTAADRSNSVVQLLLATSRDVDVRSLGRETLGACEADTAVGSSDDCDLSFKSAHGVLLESNGRLNIGACISLLQ